MSVYMCVSWVRFQLFFQISDAESSRNVDTVRYFADGNETPVVAIEMKNVGKKSSVGVGVVNERQTQASKIHKPGKSRKSKILISAFIWPADPMS